MEFPYDCKYTLLIQILIVCALPIQEIAYWLIFENVEATLRVNMPSLLLTAGAVTTNRPSTGMQGISGVLAMSDPKEQYKAFMSQIGETHSKIYTTVS